MAWGTQKRAGWAAAMVLGLLAADTAAAQYGGGVQPGGSRLRARPVPTDMRTPFQDTGIVEGIVPGGLVANVSGATWAVKPDRVCKVEVTGTAEPEFLRPGLLIRFSGVFDNKGKAAAPLNELEIVTPQTAMVTEKGRGGEPVAKKGKDAASAPPIGQETYVGKISALRNNELTIDTGNGQLRAELGANPAIKVNVSDVSVAQPGDKVELRGYYVQPGALLAQDIKIALANPLTDASKKKAAARAAGKAPAGKSAAGKSTSAKAPGGKPGL